MLFLLGHDGPKSTRRPVDPEALEAGNERFEERPDYVLVMQVLNRKEVKA